MPPPPPLRRAAALRAALVLHFLAAAAAAASGAPRRPGRSLAQLRASASAAQTAAARASRQPPPSGHFLTDHELKPIVTISCLEAKQKDRNVQCTGNAFTVQRGGKVEGPLNAGNYPSWKEGRCLSGGEFFCDPNDLLTSEERNLAREELRTLREQASVTCDLKPPQVGLSHGDYHYQPFYLGVALANGWPHSEAGPDSLQFFGQVVASRWNMTYLWNGYPPNYAGCPNQAMLVILPDLRQAYVSSPSCQFICQDRGGREVVTAVLADLDRHGLSQAVQTGIWEVYHVVNATGAVGRAFKKAIGADAVKVVNLPNELDPGLSLAVNWTQRILYVIAVITFFLSLGVALLVCWIAPGLRKELKKTTV